MSGVYVSRGVNKRYWIRVRERGRRKFHVIGKPSRSKTVAFLRLARMMANSNLYSRGEILLSADYYDFTLIAKMDRP
jgi:hypothetical protein